MKCKIFYASFTGNTKLVAERIKQGIESAGHTCELTEMRDFTSDPTLQELSGFNLLGFMSPVFGWREPTIWRRFLARLPRVDAQPIFIGASAGGNFGNYFYRVEKQLAKKGMYSIANVAVITPSSYIPWNPLEETCDPRQLAEAEEFGRKLPAEYEEIVAQKKILPPEIHFNISGAFLGTFAGHNFTLRTPLSRIKVDENLCIKCGICRDNCAWGAITMQPKATFPKFTMKLCGGCCACINLCPKDVLHTKHTKGKVRYHEPSFKGYKKK